MRRAAKVDLTHAPIRDHLLMAGWSVKSTARVGDDFPDLIVARRGFTALIECKTGKKKLSEGQSEFHRHWPGVVIKANNPLDAELQLDLAEKYQYLRRSINHLENDEPVRIEKPRSREPSKIVRMLGGEA